MTLRWQCFITAALAALGAACDIAPGTGTGLSNAPTTTALTATISTAPILTGPCLFGSTFTPSVAVFVSASATASLNQVTLHLTDGSNVGGASVTFPAAAIRGQAGTTRIEAGDSRTFAFEPQFTCAAFLPQFVVANIDFLDAVGASQSLTIQAPLR